MSRDPKNQFITRVGENTLNGGGWWVRFTHNVDGKTRTYQQKSFADIKHGGKIKSLKKARKWRDEKKNELGLQDAHQHRLKKRAKKARSNTGVVGVTRMIDIRDDRIMPSFYFTCIYMMTENNKRKTVVRHFSFDPSVHDSEKQAFEKACKLRKEMEAIHYTN